MVGADDEQARLAGKRILRDHASTGLDVALREVEHLGPRRIEVLGLEAIHRAVDVERHDVVGLDEGQRELGVFLVGLHVVGQAHGRELRLVPFGAQLLDRELAQATRERRVLPAADAEHEALLTGGAQVVLEKVGAQPHLLGRVDGRNNIEVIDDACLQGVHEPNLLRMMGPSPGARDR